MKVLFRKENLKITITTLAYLIFGVLFCVMPVRIYNFAEAVLCVVLLLAGIACISIYALMSHDDKPFSLLIYGIISVVLGLFILMWPRLFGIILSVVVCLTGLILVIEYVKNKKQQQKTNALELVVGIVVVILSLVAIVLSGTNVSKNIISVFFGVICLIQTIYNITQIVALLKSIKKQTSVENKTIEEKEIKIDEKSEKIEK